MPNEPRTEAGKRLLDDVTPAGRDSVEHAELRAEIGADIERVEAEARATLLDGLMALLIAVDNAALDALVGAEDGSEVPDWQERLWDAADQARALLDDHKGAEK